MAQYGGDHTDFTKGMLDNSLQERNPSSLGVLAMAC
jgi:hypothetical protein